MTPQIIFQDKNFLVLNKPAGMIVNNTDTARDEYTVQDFIKENYVKEEGESEFLKRNGVVHRLDKETSGILIVALNERSFENLKNQFKDRLVKKEYIALCHGRIASEGQVNVPIGRLPWNRTRFGVIPSGREAFSEFVLIKHFSLKVDGKMEDLSLVRVFPKTGRTHQIRVHFQYLGYPLFSDSLYSGRKTYKKDSKLLKRHFLHASKIIFNDPENGQSLAFEAELTEDLSAFLNSLK